MKAFAKQLFGAGYERIGKSMLVCLILFLVIYSAGLEVMISPSVFWLTVTALPAGIMWQVLTSAQNENSLRNLFMLPFRNRELTFSIVLTFAGHTLITKTFPVLALLFAVHRWSLAQIMVSLLCGFNGCMIAAAWYSMMKNRKLLRIFLWGAAIFSAIFFIERILAFGLIVFVSLALSVLQLSSVDAYVFYHPVRAKGLTRHANREGSVFLYLVRYLVTNKSYLWNTVVLLAVACYLPAMLGQFEGLRIMPLGFAVLCLNTPICILLSCDPGLEQAVRMLPEQVSRFCVRYCLFIFMFHMAVNSVYVVSWQIWNGGVGWEEGVTALLFAFQSAVLSVLLEWLYPIRNWKVESDLWHHPRKYFVPAVMLLVAGLLSICPLGVWPWIGALLAEVLFLALFARRISLL